MCVCVCVCFRGQPRLEYVQGQRVGSEWRTHAIEDDHRLPFNQDTFRSRETYLKTYHKQLGRKGSSNLKTKQNKTKQRINREASVIQVWDEVVIENGEFRCPKTDGNADDKIGQVYLLQAGVLPLNSDGCNFS